MPLVNAKCTSCGATIEVNPEAQALVCKYCGSAFVVEQAINNYNNYITSNIQAQFVNVQGNGANININGKNKDAIIERGLNILGKTSFIDDSNFNDLNEIAKDILSIESNNFYGTLFEFATGKEKIEKCFSLISNPKEKDILLKCILTKIKGNLALVLDYNEIILHNVLRNLKTDYVALLKFLHDHKSEFSNENIESIDKLFDEIKSNVFEISNIIYKNALNFYYSSDTLKDYKFKEELYNLVIYGLLYIKFISESLDIEEEMEQFKNNLFKVIENNFEILSTDNSGTFFINQVAKYTNKENELVSLKKKQQVLINGMYVSYYPVTFKGFYDHFIVEGLPNNQIVNIACKDIILVNFDTYSNNNRGILTFGIMFDIVYNIDDSTYSLVHFAHNYKTKRFTDDEVFVSLQKWITLADLKQEYKEYNGTNPYSHGYNGKSYVDTLPELKKGCYIATCVYGSYDCPQVWVLRRFRDYKLSKTWYGRLFIKVYYATSPTLVKYFGKTSWFKSLWRKKLNRMVNKYKKEGYSDSPYDDNNY